MLSKTENVEATVFWRKCVRVPSWPCIIRRDVKEQRKWVNRYKVQYSTLELKILELF